MEIGSQSQWRPSTGDAARGKSFLISGGAGCVGAHVVEQIAKTAADDVSIDVAGRRPTSRLPQQIASLFRRHQIRYHQRDLYQPAADRSSFLSRFDIVIDASEPFVELSSNGNGEGSGVGDHVARSEQLFQDAVEAGFTVGVGKAFVRISSPVEFRRFKDPWEGDALRSLGSFEEGLPVRECDLEGRFHDRHPAWSLSYTKVKLGIRDAAQTLHSSRGFAVISVAPTMVIGWLGVHEQEYIDLFWNLPPWLRCTLPVADFYVDMIAGDDMGDGVLAAAVRGKCGETYQIAGTACSVAHLVHHQLSCGRRLGMPWLHPYARDRFGLERADR